MEMLLKNVKQSKFTKIRIEALGNRGQNGFFSSIKKGSAS